MDDSELTIIPTTSQIARVVALVIDGRLLSANVASVDDARMIVGQLFNDTKMWMHLTQFLDVSGRLNVDVD